MFYFVPGMFYLAHCKNIIFNSLTSCANCMNGKRKCTVYWQMIKSAAISQAVKIMIHNVGPCGRTLTANTQGDSLVLMSETTRISVLQVTRAEKNDIVQTNDKPEVVQRQLHAANIETL